MTNISIIKGMSWLKVKLAQGYAWVSTDWLSAEREEERKRKKRAEGPVKYQKVFWVRNRERRM